MTKPLSKSKPKAGSSGIPPKKPSWSKPNTQSSSPENPSAKVNSESCPKHERGTFKKNLQHMMYGFGDDQNPLPETMALVEDIVVDYLTDLVHGAQDVASSKGKRLVQSDDLMFIIRNDAPKVNRCRELLAMDKVLENAKKLMKTKDDY